MMPILVIINHKQTLLFYNCDKINRRIYKNKLGNNLANDNSSSPATHVRTNITSALHVHLKKYILSKAYNLAKNSSSRLKFGYWILALKYYILKYFLKNKTTCCCYRYAEAFTYAYMKCTNRVHKERTEIRCHLYPPEDSGKAPTAFRKGFALRM